MTHQPQAQVQQLERREQAAPPARDFSHVIQSLLEGFAPRTQVEVWIDGEPPCGTQQWSQT